jgi:hypothetical protein
MQNITNPHFMYLHSSIATQTQVYDYLQRGLDLLENYYGRKFDREMVVNTVTKYDGTPLKHSYVWCRSVDTVNVLLNKTPDGQERYHLIEDPEHDTSEAEKNLFDFLIKSFSYGTSWTYLVEEEERLSNLTVKRSIKRTMTPVVDFGVINVSDEQRIRFPDYKEISVSLFTVGIQPKSGYSFNRLFAYTNNKDVDESFIRRQFEKYASSVKKDITDRRQYPVVYVDRRSTPAYVTVTFHPSTMDGIFALQMNKKLHVSDKCVLSFDLCKRD